MPLDASLKKVLIIGAGPIVIGQACEFDYSGTQACKAMREEGIEVVLLNSNPATIMTDPEVADRTYVEPVTWETTRKILIKEKPDAILPTLGGQTSLNTAIELAKRGVLKELGVRLLGADVDVIERAENRQQFKDVVTSVGLESPRSKIAHTLAEALEAQTELGLPSIVRPSFTMGGTGGGIAYNVDEFRSLVESGLRASPNTEVLVEESVIGWKEYELEVVRDRADNCIVICSIENIDPMGVHTGDSITVAPALTLTDREYQRMRDAAFVIMRAIGVECGGSNVQFAVNPENGDLRVIEMNPRVSRSSALASKATGFPIAKIATKLALGYTLDELSNDITKTTPASFEPAIDYIVTKIPRFDLEKFPGADGTLTTAMKSVGEAMAMGRTFKESLQKALRSLESGRFGLGLDRRDRWGTPQAPTREEIMARLSTPSPGRIFFLRYALLSGLSVEEVQQATGIDPWFIGEIQDLVSFEGRLRAQSESPLEGLHDLILEAKRMGYTDSQLATALRRGEDAIRAFRLSKGIVQVYRTVDTCAAEFAARTPYFYSTWGEADDAVPSSGKQKVVILGGGPNRIGQGIEFDCCCIHAAIALREDGYETIMVNSNPETVSTDYDISDRLYFEPLTFEDVMGIIEREKPLGVIVQLGGQTPLNLSLRLQAAGVNILGTSPEAIHRAEDREAFAEVLEGVGITRPTDGTARTFEEALEVARRIGYPVMVRPSYVLGGRGMSVVHDNEQLREYVNQATQVSPDHPVLIDQFLSDAIEVDVDLLRDASGMVVIGGILEHIEEAGVHSGDASCAFPPYTLPPLLLDRLREASAELANALQVKGLMNVQYAVKDEVIYVLEANPRASRTVPFISKATGRPLAKIAARIMVGQTLREQGVTTELQPPRFAIKKSVFPWNRFPGCSVLLGPEMRSTGEVMGMDKDFGAAFAKAQAGASEDLATRGAVFVTVRDQDKRQVIYIAKKLASLGFDIVATLGTHKVLEKNGVDRLRKVHKINAGRPDPLDMIRNGQIELIVNTPSHGRIAHKHEREIRALAVARGVPCFTTIPAAAAAVSAIEHMCTRELEVEALQDIPRVSSALEAARRGLPSLTWAEAHPAQLKRLPPPAVPLRTLRRALAKAARPLVLVNDSARLLPRDQSNVLGTLCQELGELPLVVATGTHRADIALHRDRLGGLPLALHDADDASAHVALDEAGELQIDRRVARADLIIAWGSVEPHYFAGWTGAHKTASIGVLARSSIALNHEHALQSTARPLALEGNPVFDGLARVLSLLEEDRRLLAINQVLDATGAPVSTAVGTWRGSLERCLGAARRRFVHVCEEQVDVLVARVAGPLSKSLYQADKGLKNNEAAVRDGGDLILEASLEGGLGPDRFVRFLRGAPDLAAARAAVAEGYVLGDHKAVRWRALEARGVRVSVVSPHLDPGCVASAGITVTPDLETALAAVAAGGRGAHGRGLVVQDAGNLVTTLAKG